MRNSKTLFRGSAQFVVTLASVISLVSAPLAQASQQQPVPANPPISGPDPRPMVAPAAQPDTNNPNPQPQKRKDVRNIFMGLDEAKNSLMGMKLKFVGTGNARKAIITYRVFDRCVSEAGSGFDVRAKYTDDGLAGIEVLDRPNASGLTLRDCTAQLKGTESCQAEGACQIRTVEVNVPGQPVKGDKVQAISLFQENLATYEIEAFPLDGGEYETAAEIRAKRDAEIKAKRDEMARDAWAEYEDCRGSLSGLDQARDAIVDLMKAEAIDADEAERMDASLTRDEAKLLSNAAKSCKADTDDLRDKAQRLVARDPELADKIAAEVYPALIKCTLSEEGDREVTSDDFATAQELLEEAGDLDGVSSKTRSSLKKFNSELKIGRAMFYARQGEAAYPQYLAARMKIQQDLMKQVQGCMSRPARTAEAFAACRVAQNDAQRIPQMLDMQYQAAAIQQQQMWMQMNPYQSQFGGSAPLGAAPNYGYGGAGGSFGSNQYNGYGQTFGQPGVGNPQVGGGGYAGITPFVNGNPQGQPGVPQQFAGGGVPIQQGPTGPQYFGGTYGQPMPPRM